MKRAALHVVQEAVLVRIHDMTNPTQRDYNISPECVQVVSMDWYSTTIAFQSLFTPYSGKIMILFLSEAHTNV